MKLYVGVGFTQGLVPLFQPLQNCLFNITFRTLAYRKLDRKPVVDTPLAVQLKNRHTVGKMITMSFEVAGEFFILTLAIISIRNPRLLHFPVLFSYFMPEHEEQLIN